MVAKFILKSNTIMLVYIYRERLEKSDEHNVWLTG